MSNLFRCSDYRYMKKVLLCILAIFIVWIGYMYLNLKPQKGPLSPKITFLQSQPLIDGILDQITGWHMEQILFTSILRRKPIVLSAGIEVIRMATVSFLPFRIGYRVKIKRMNIM
jgi:hypothetical protein